MEEPKFLSGQLLLAMPGIGDARFERAVIAMCSHDEQGALGIGLGRLIPRIHFHDLLRQLDIEPGAAPDVPIHLGGPVEPQRGFLLHSLDWGGQESLQVSNRWALTATLDILRAIAEGNGWFATPGDDTLLYDCDVNSRWAAAFRSAGIDTRLLTAESGTA
jgi:putative transcriptional regulator